MFWFVRLPQSLNIMVTQEHNCFLTFRNRVQYLGSHIVHSRSRGLNGFRGERVAEQLNRLSSQKIAKNEESPEKSGQPIPASVTLIGKLARVKLSVPTFRHFDATFAIVLGKIWNEFFEARKNGLSDNSLGPGPIRFLRDAKRIKNRPAFAARIGDERRMDFRQRR